MDDETMEDKKNNDPWVPLDEDASSSTTLLIPSAPRDPLREMMDSERYIQMLEKKLAQLKARREEPSSKDIITSLALFHDDQMKRYITDTEMAEHNLATSNGTSDPVPQASFVQRKLHPEKQPLTAEEIAELIKDDILAKVFEESSNIDCELNILDQGTSSFGLSRPAENNAAASGGAPLSEHQQNGTDQDRDNRAISNSVDEGWANFDEPNHDIQDGDISSP